LEISQILAQPVALFPKGSQLNASIAVRAGWAERNEFTFEDAYPFIIYLKGGKSTSISMSMGSNYLGFNLQYLNDRFDIDIDKTIANQASIMSIELAFSGQKRLQSTGFLIGPYIGSNFGKKKRFRAEIIPAIGMISTTSPHVKISYSSGGSSFPGPEIHTRFIYSIGLGAEYAFAKGFAIGAMWRDTFNNTTHFYNESLNNVLISLSYRLLL